MKNQFSTTTTRDFARAERLCHDVAIGREWGAKVRTTRFADDGVVAVAAGDIGEAYAPSCAEDGCTKRSVQQIVRTFAFVRPSLLVLDDRVVLERPEYDVTWVPSPRGTRERGFLQFITVDRASAAAPAARRVSGEGIRGCVRSVEGRRMAVLFADPKKEGHVSLGDGADLVLVTGLEPGRRYKVSVSPAASCLFDFSPANDASGSAATAGGFIRVSATECGAR